MFLHVVKIWMIIALENDENCVFIWNSNFGCDDFLANIDRTGPEKIVAISAQCKIFRPLFPRKLDLRQEMIIFFSFASKINSVLVY